MSSNREEIAVLKSENDTLLEFIGASKENKSSQVEPGWVTVLATQVNKYDMISMSITSPHSTLNSSSYVEQ